MATGQNRSTTIPHTSAVTADGKEREEMTGQLMRDRIGPTGVTYRPARDILTKTSGFMNAYDFTLNPYSGCSFGCSYCYAVFFSRDQAQQDSWGLWVNAKQNAAQLLEDLKQGELDGKRIYMSSVTDPYQPLEQRILLTQQILEAMANHHRPKLVVQTRSPLVTRDIPLFQEIEQRGGRVQINMTVTTDDEDVRKTFEPGCPSNPARLKAIQQIQTAGIQSCITMTPLLLVRDADNFCDSLLATGVERFIAQTFHFEKGEFVAQTRKQAFDIMAEKLDCPVSQFQPRYVKHYREVFQTMKARLPQLGEGRQGFAPPF